MKAEKQETGVLTAILGEARLRADRLGSQRADLERLAAGREAPPFARALRGTSVTVIAEVKRRSPSAGAIREGADAAVLAGRYFAAGAAAVSVLTEPAHFGGSIDDLAAVAALGRPTLRKDFIVDEVQLLEAKAFGGSAALLIVRALGARRLGDLIGYARTIGLETLVEVHDAAELDVALAAGAPVVGVNSRDLETLVMNAHLVTELLPHIPAGVIAVAESGIASRADVERVARAGADAVLVGTALARAEDPGAVLAPMTGVARSPVSRLRSPV